MAALFVFLVPTTERTKLHESVTRCKQGKTRFCVTRSGECITFAHLAR